MAKERSSRFTASTFVFQSYEQEPEIPYDTLTVKVLNLGISGIEPKYYIIKVIFMDQLLLSSVIQGDNIRKMKKASPELVGNMNYDPSDYARMSLFANSPLVVQIMPQIIKTHYERNLQSEEEDESVVNKEMMCCNIDILQLFLGNEDTKKICVKKRMQPFIKPSVLKSESWDCLPLVQLEVSVTRDPAHSEHHELLKDPNWMKITLIGAYNMILPYRDDICYVAASKMPVWADKNTEIVTFNETYGVPKNFNHTCFYKKWESLKFEETMPMSDEKFVCELKDFANPNNIDLYYYVKRKLPLNTVLWTSFHRTLLLTEDSKKWMLYQIFRYKWPLELNVNSDSCGYSFMALLDLSRLLYPGVTKLRFAVPLEWANASKMSEECNCDPLLTPNAANSSTATKVSRGNETNTDMSMITDEKIITRTGADDNDAFVLLEVEIRKPFKEIEIPERIPQADLLKMLKAMEELNCEERRCTGLGQHSKDWMSTVRTAAASLRRVPYYGTTELNTFTRQLSETRTRVELITSFWQEAAIYVNNKFVVKQYLHSQEIFEELVMMAHVCLMKIACETLLSEAKPETDWCSNSARQARQMQDMEHAKRLYMQLVVKRPNDANCWRELSTCLKDLNKDWAYVCLNKAVVLDPRHPLTLVSKGGMVFEEDPAAAEMFFVALLAYYPFWTTAWIVASAYYYDRQEYLVCDKILETVKQSRRDGETEELGYARSWERELGDWWDITPILPGANPYYDAADLLLRLRCIALAEVCVARALTMSGETPSYFHLVALCCRLRGKYEDAICHLGIALGKFGEILYLRSLEAECYHKLNNTEACLESYAKAGCSGGPFTVLMALPSFQDSLRIRPVLADLVRCHPSAYAWMALADNWMSKSGVKEFINKNILYEEHDETAVNAAIACAEQALKRDRLFGPAWAFLATVVKPSARRLYCLKMASICGYNIDNSGAEADSESLQSLCYKLGKPIHQCRCKMEEDKI